MIQPGGFQRQIDAEEALTREERYNAALRQIVKGVGRIYEIKDQQREHVTQHGPSIACKYDRERILWEKYLDALCVYALSVKD